MTNREILQELERRLSIGLIDIDKEIGFADEHSFHMERMALVYKSKSIRWCISKVDEMLSDLDDGSETLHTPLTLTQGEYTVEPHSYGISEDDGKRIVVYPREQFEK